MPNRDTDTRAHFTLFSTALGDCAIAWTGDSVVATGLPEVTPTATVARLAARTGATEGEPSSEIQRAIRAIAALLDGERTDLFFIHCDFGEVDPFTEQVYAATRAIPAGQIRTYGEIASQLGDKQLSRRVGQALGRNPIPIIVPCHRVLGADGRLTGFSALGGTETKLKLLNIERASIGQSSGLFEHLPMATRPQR